MELLLIVGLVVFLLSKMNKEPKSSKGKQGTDDFEGFGIGALFLLEEVVDQPRKKEAGEEGKEERPELTEYDAEWCDEEFYDEF